MAIPFPASTGQISDKAASLDSASLRRRRLIAPIVGGLAIGASGVSFAVSQNLSDIGVAVSFLLLAIIAFAVNPTRLRQSMGRLYTALEVDSAPCLLTDQHGNIIHTNPAFTATSPVNANHIQEVFKDILFDPSSKNPYLENFLDVQKNPSSATIILASENILLKINHDLVRVCRLPVSLQAAWLWRFDSPPTNVETHDSKTSDSKMSRTLSTTGSNQDIGGFIENAPVGFYSLDQQGCFQFVNHTLAQWLDSTSEDMVTDNASIRDFIVGLPREQIDQEKIQGEKTGEKAPFTIEDRRISLCGRQGRLLHARIFQKTTTGPAGPPLTWGMIYDVTQEAVLEKALRETMQHFQKLFHAAPTGIALLDLEGRIIECNTVMCRLLGYTPNSDNLPVGHFIIDQEKAQFDELIDRLIKRGQAQHSFEVQLSANSTRKKRVARFFASRMEDDVGNVTGLILHGLDTTEQKQLEIQFAQSQKMQAVGQLAGGIAHDFNNLLTAMLGFCDLLLQRHQPGEQSFADVMQIKQNANRAANLVRQLLAFSRQQAVSPKILNLTDILADISHLLRRLIGETISLDIQYGRDIGAILMDQGQLEQVIINLAVNARDAMSEGGILTIRTHNIDIQTPIQNRSDIMPVGQYVLIEVADTGIGIPPENLAHIFDPFYSTKEVGSGTGLGLSTVEGIVRQSGGYVFAESTPGQGATFRVYLPHHTAVVTKEQENSNKTGAGDLTGSGTILLVEDEDAVRLFSARALRSKGYNVLEARSGNAAVELIEQTQEQIDLLITDVVMPDMDGPTLVNWIRQNRPHVGIICISGYAEESVRTRITQSSDITFLSKPFNLSELAGTVKKSLQNLQPPTS